MCAPPPPHPYWVVIIDQSKYLIGLSRVVVVVVIFIVTCDARQIECLLYTTQKQKKKAHLKQTNFDRQVVVYAEWICVKVISYCTMHLCAVHRTEKKKLISIFPFHFGHFHNWSLDSKSVFIELINARARAVFVIDYSFYFQNLYVYHGVIYLVNWQPNDLYAVVVVREKIVLHSFWQRNKFEIFYKFYVFGVFLIL